MKTTRRSFLGLLACIPVIRLTAHKLLANTPPGEVPISASTGPLVVRSRGRLVETLDLTITAQIRGPYVINNHDAYELADEHHATFRTSALDVRPGEDLRVYYDGVCCFSGHVQQVTHHTPPFGNRPFLEVRADDLMFCKRPPIGWKCTKLRGHDGPCPTVRA